MKRVAIITSHPIQYNAPLFKLLAERKRLEIKVFYTWGQTFGEQIYDPEFNLNRQWDVPLLDHYSFEFVENVSKKPGSHHFYGIDNPTLIRRIEIFDPHSILVYGWAFKSHLKVLRFFSGKRQLIFRGDSTLLNTQSSIKKLLRRMFLTWVYSHIDIALFVGINNKKYFREYGVPHKKLVYAPHAIENDRFINVSAHDLLIVENWRSILGFRASDTVLIFAGKFIPQKQPEFLLKILSLVKNENVKLLFVGNGVLENELKKAASGNKRVQFLDFQNQSAMPLVYRLGDILILPSISETWGLSINEAMASGLPVIASDKCGGAIDLINNETGLIFYDNNVSTVVNFIEHFSSDPELKSHYKNAVQKFISSFSFVKVAAAIEKCIE